MRVYCVHSTNSVQSMKTFVGIVVIMLLSVLFSVQNTTVVTVKVVTFLIPVPLSLAIIMPAGIIFLFFALFYFGKMSKVAVVIRDLEDSVERAQKKVLEVAKRTHELEIENRKFKIRLGDQLDTDERSL